MRYTVFTIGLDKSLKSALTEEADKQNIYIHHIGWQQWLHGQLELITTRKNSLRFSLEVSPGVRLESEKVHGLISFDRYIPRKYVVEHYPESDHAYIYSAWQSAWLSTHKSIKQIINRVDYSTIQANYLNLPHSFKIATSVGISIPQWGFCSQASIKRDYICTSNQSLLQNHNFAKSYEQGMFSMEYIEGIAIVVLIVGDTIIVRQADRSFHNIVMPPKMLTKLHALRKKVSQNVIELFFKVTDKRWVLHRISTSPEWKRWWLKDLTITAKALFRTLGIKLKQETKKKKPFIKNTLRPFCGEDR